MSTPKLFQPIQVGDLQLEHRVVLAPLTRVRADKKHVHQLPIAQEYYTQRASVPGTLLITEATFIAAQAGGINNVPGIWSDEQVTAWKKVSFSHHSPNNLLICTQITESVHAKGSFIYLQLWALGRAASPKQLEEEGSFPYVSSSDIPLSNRPKEDPSPRPLTLSEIKEFVELYATAASNAVHRAGFDGVEIHGANGYLIDQFLQTTSNRRTDDYGGSVENRARFALEVTEAVVKRIGAKKTGIRFSPWGSFQG
jgi:NADPH2 dehydrogenase